MTAGSVIGVVVPPYPLWVMVLSQSERLPSPLFRKLCASTQPSTGTHVAPERIWVVMPVSRLRVKNDGES